RLAGLSLVERPMHQTAAVLKSADHRRGSGDAAPVREVVAGFRCWHRHSPDLRAARRSRARALSIVRSPIGRNRVRRGDRTGQSRWCRSSHAYPVDAYRSKMPQHVVAPSWSTCSKVEFGRPGARGTFNEKVRLLQRLTDPRAGDVEIFLVGFDTDEPAAKLDGCNARRAGAAERVEDRFIPLNERDERFHDRDGLLGRMARAPVRLNPSFAIRHAP